MTAVTRPVPPNESHRLVAYALLCSAVQCKMPLLAEVTEGAEARRVEEWDEVTAAPLATLGRLSSAALARAMHRLCNFRGGAIV